MAKTWCTIAARIFVVCATIPAFLILVLFKKTVDLGNSTTLEVKHTDWTSLRYFVIANGITSGYNFFLIFLPSGSLLWRPVAVADIIITILITTGGTAGAAVTYLMKNGIPGSVGEQHYCCLVPVFCDHVVGALASCFVGVVIQFLLTLYTSIVVMDPLLMKQDMG